MDDLRASIRKIIADGEVDLPRPALRLTPSLHREPHSPRRAPDTDGGLSALVERSVLDAFGVVDAERGRAPWRGRPEPATGNDTDDEAEIEAAVNSIAEAIAAERQGRSRRSDPDLDPGMDDAAWSGGVLGKLDLDREPRRSARAEPAAPPARVAASRVAAARAPSLQARFEVPARAERPARPACPEREPAGPMRPGVCRPEPEGRTPERTDAAVDAKLQDGDGKAFRRQTPARAELDEGLTGARTRQSVSSRFDQLSRTILTDNPRTLEDLVRDMMRPLLREWLDANLPDIVERQVRQEIDRLSAKGR